MDKHTRKRYTKLSYVNVFDIGSCIRAHCHLQDGYAVYEAGWSDSKVAITYGIDPTSSHVKELRKQLVGELRYSRASSDRIARLEERIERLERELGLTTS
jgi:hypothetical protein